MKISKISVAPLRSSISSSKNSSVSNANMSANQSPEKLTNYLSNMASVSFAGLSIRKQTPAELSPREIKQMHQQADSQLLASRAERAFANMMTAKADSALDEAKATVSDSIKNIRYSMENFPLAIREVKNGSCKFFDEYKDGNIARRSYFMQTGENNISLIRIEDRKKDGSLDLIELIPNNEIASIAKGLKTKSAMNADKMPSYILVPGRHNPSGISYTAENEFHFIADSLTSAKTNVKKAENGKYKAEEEYEYSNNEISSVQNYVKVNNGNTKIQQKFKFDNYAPQNTLRIVRQLNGINDDAVRVSNNITANKDGSASIAQEFYFYGNKLQQYTEDNKKAADSLIMQPAKKWVNTSEIIK